VLAVASKLAKPAKSRAEKISEAVRPSYR